MPAELACSTINVGPDTVTHKLSKLQRLRRLLPLAGFALPAFLFSGCSGGSDPVVVGQNQASQPKGSLLVEPASFILTEGETVTLSAKLGSTVVGASQVTWSASPASVAVVDRYGVVTALKHGEATITARYSSLTATSEATVWPLPKAIEALSSPSLAGIVGRPLSDSLAVRVVGDDGAPVPQVEVHFEILSGDGTLSHQTRLTGLDGIARVDWTLGTRAGVQELKASVPELGELAFQAEALPDYESASVELLGGDEQDGMVTTFLPEPLRAQVLDQFQNPLPGMTVEWTFSDGGGALGTAGSPDATAPVLTSSTDAEGKTEIYWKLGIHAGLQEAECTPVVGAASGTAGALGGSGPSAAPTKARGRKWKASATPAPPDTVRIDPSEARTLVGRQTKLSAAVLDPYGNVVDVNTLNWKADDSGVVAVDGTGTVTGLKVGTAQVTAEAPKLKLESSAVVIVETPRPTSLQRSSGNGQKGVVGSALPVPVGVQVLDQGGSPVAGVEVMWSAGSGSAGAAGEAANGATASAGGPSDPVTVTDLDGVAETTWLLGTSAGTQQLIAAVDGVAPVTFTAEATPGPAATAAVDPSTAEVEVGKTQSFTPSGQDEFGNPIPAERFTWTVSNVQVANVSADGVVTGLAAGTAEVKASADGLEAIATVTVTEPPPPPPPAQPVAVVQITPSSIELEVGQAHQFTAVARTAEGIPVEGVTFAWATSDPEVASVTGYGNVEAVSDGTAQITATAGGVTGSAEVRVTLPLIPTQKPEQVTDLAVVAVEDSAVTLRWTQVDDGTGAPARYAIRYGSPTLTWWEAYPTEVSVDGTAIGAPLEFRRSGLEPGTAYEFRLVAYRGTLNEGATFGPLSNTVQAATTAPAPQDPVVASVVVTPSELTFTALEETAQLQAEALDSVGGPVSDAILSWSSLDTSIATVDSMGLVTAKAVGSTLIVASAACCGGKADSVAVTISQAPDSLVVIPSAMELPEGENRQLAAVVFDRNGYAMQGAPLTWSSSNPSVATVDPDGTVTAVSPGAAQIIAQSEGLSGSSVVQVVDTTTPPPVTSGWEHEPMGYTVFTDRAVTALDEDGWNDGGRASVVPDPNSPFSPGYVLQFYYPEGAGGEKVTVGGGVADFRPPAGTREVYLGFYMKLSDPWDEHSSGKDSPKLVFFRDNGTGGGGDPFYIRRSYTAEGGVIAGKVQNSGAPPNRYDLVENLGHVRIDPGKWYKVEVLVKTNTPGENYDGEFHLWVDGVKVAEHKDIWYSDAEVPQWSAVSFQPLWGGQGDVLQHDNFLWVDHVRISGR